jgi:two-component system, NtrC family, response regulator PilR
MDGYRILIVDDDQQIREMLQQFFTKMGYLVMTAEMGKDGLEKFMEHPFDCVISDLVMPDMDGLALLKRVKERSPKTLFFLITGYGTVENAVQGIKEGAHDFITKPFLLEDLKIRVERALRSQILEKSVKKMTGMLWAVMISIPLWLILGIVLGIVWKRF